MENCMFCDREYDPAFDFINDTDDAIIMNNLFPNDYYCGECSEKFISKVRNYAVNIINL